MSVLRRMTAAGLCLVVGSTLAFAGKRVMAPRKSIVQAAQKGEVWPPPPPVDSAGAFKRGVRGPILPIPVSSFGRHSPGVLEPEGVRLRYQGTIISPNSEATGRALTLQKEISSLISQMDFKPAVRLAHFRWLDDQPVTVNAWRGTIEDLQQTPSGILARVRVWPNVVPLRGKPRVAHMDHFYEMYLYAEGRATLVGSEDPGPNPGFHLL